MTIFDYGNLIIIKHIKKHFDILFLVELTILESGIKMMNRMK
jgi:hypothetical protein